MESIKSPEQQLSDNISVKCSISVIQYHEPTVCFYAAIRRPCFLMQRRYWSCIISQYWIMAKLCQMLQEAIIAAIRFQTVRINHSMWRNASIAQTHSSMRYKLPSVISPHEPENSSLHNIRSVRAFLSIWVFLLCNNGNAKEQMQKTSEMRFHFTRFHQE